MDWFELNSHLRLLRQSKTQNTSFLKQPLGTSTKSIQASNVSNAQFVISGQRLETLKSLRKLLRKFPSRLNHSTISSIFDVLKSIIAELTLIYFNLDGNLTNNQNGSNNHHPHQMVRWNSMAQIPTNSKTQPPLLRKTLSTDNVFIAAVRRNEILECIQIIIDLISMKSLAANQDQQSQSANSNNQQLLTSASTNAEYDAQDLGCQEDYFGRTFLPEIITLLGKMYSPMNITHIINLSFF